MGDKLLQAIEQIKDDVIATLLSQYIERVSNKENKKVKAKLLFFIEKFTEVKY